MWKMQSYTKFDRQLEEAISKKAKSIHSSDDMFQKINEKIDSGYEEVTVMKLNSRKSLKGLLVACCVLAATTATCFAAAKIVSYTGTSTNAFTDFPSQAEVEKSIDCSPKYIENFKNGFSFVGSSIGEYVGADADGNEIAKVKEIEFTYIKNGMDGEVTLGAEKVVDGVDTIADSEEDAEKVVLNDEIQGVYFDYSNKCVPPTYELTEQDKIDEENRTYVFSYGSDSIEVKHIQYVGWKQDGIAYYVGCYDDCVDKDEMVEMAKEIVMEK